MFGLKPKADALTVAALQIKPLEGEVKKNGRHVVYKDSKGILTLGHGRNVEGRGLSDDEAEYLFKNDIKDHAEIARDYAGKSWDAMGVARQAALINMAFMGRGAVGQGGLFSLIRLRGAIFEKNWTKAGKIIRESKWYQDVKEHRGELVAKQMETGEVQ